MVAPGTELISVGVERFETMRERFADGISLYVSILTWLVCGPGVTILQLKYYSEPPHGTLQCVPICCVASCSRTKSNTYH